MSLYTSMIYSFQEYHKIRPFKESKNSITETTVRWFDSTKIEVYVPRFKCLGHSINAEGLHPLPEKIDAITKAPAPTSITELKAFLGLMNYYGKFIPNLTSLLQPMYQLLHKSTHWNWTREREEAFNNS